MSSAGSSGSEKLNRKASGVVALAVMLSRVLGLVREMLFAGLFGSGLMGIFTIAFRAPNLLRDLFAEGALSTAFITVFSQQAAREGPQAAWALARKMLTLAAVFMSAVSLLGVLLAGPLIGLLAPGFAPEDAGMTILLTRIMFPFILLVSLAALVMGMLNSRNVFAAPALASSFFNIGSILGGALFGWMIDPAFGPRALVGLALGTLVGGLFQLLIQLPSLGAVGFRFAPDFRWRDPGVRRILVLMVPSVIAASAVQINVMVNSSFASFAGKEAVSWLNFAFRLMQLPIGVFGVAVATITLPVVSRIAAGSSLDDFGPTLGRALRLALFFTLPSAAGLFILAGPIIGLIYERGEFKAHDTLQTAFALQFYALGLVAYSCIKVLSPAFYAINRKWTPMMVSFGSIGLNVFLNYLFLFRLGLGHRGLALSTSICATVNFLTLYVLMQQAAGRLPTTGLLDALWRTGLASAGLAAVCLAGRPVVEAVMVSGPLWAKVLWLFSLIAAGLATYLLLCLLLRVPEVREAAAIVQSKLRRRRG